MFKVPFINLPKQYENMKADIDAAMERVLGAGSFILRDDVRLFEQGMAEFLGCKHVIGVSSGTDALFLALYAQGFEPGSEVITVGHTFIATIAVIQHCGLKTVLADIDDDFNIDVKQIEGLITDKTRAIIPVHLNGRVCQMAAIEKIAQEHDLVIIEDACQSLGSMYKQKKAGTFGVGCFSTHPMKNLGCAGDGGFISTNDDALAEKLFLLRNHGQKTKEDIVAFGFSKRLDNIQAAMLNIKLKHLPQWLERRRQAAQMYHEGLNDVDALTLPHAPNEEGDFLDVYSSYCIRTEQRDELAAFLRAADIEVFAHLSIPNHQQKALGLDAFKLPKTEQTAKIVLSLPIYPEIEDGQIEYVIQTIKGFYKK